jgi:hypothetical protein
MLPWQTALRDLRPDFLSHSNAELYCIIIRCKIDSWPSRSSNDSLPIPFGEPWMHGKPFIPSGVIICEYFTTHRKCEFRLEFFGNGHSSLPEFRRLACEAARCIEPNPSSTSEACLIGIWVNHVAELACQKRPGTPLVADAFRCDSPTLPGDVRNSTDEELTRQEKEPNCVILPSNVFRASIWAIDLILHDVEQSRSSAATPLPSREMVHEADASRDAASLAVVSIPEKKRQSEDAAIKKPKTKAKRFNRGELDDKAYQLLSVEPGMSNKEIAERLGCHPKSLSSPKMIKFQALREEVKRRKERFRGPDRAGSKPPRPHGEDDDG